MLFASSSNLTSPDLSRHPRLPRARAVRCTLREGETLYIPAYWHHEVRSRAAAEGELNVALNFWFRNESAPPPGF